MTLKAITPNGLTKEHKMTEVIDSEFLHLNEDQRKKVRDALEEAAGLMQMIKDKRDQIKDIIDYAHDESGITKKTLRQTATVRHKNNYLEAAAAASELELVYETLYDTNV